MIVIGWRKLSNCAARIMYMNTNDSAKAMKKFLRGLVEALGRDLA
jgi:hypothetical protein